MTRRPALRELAERLGILPAYRPAGGGAPRRTPDATRQALVAALGFEAGDEAQARRALARLRESEAEEILAPARVARGAGARRLPLGRGATGAARFELEIRDESGALQECGGALRGARRAPPAIPLPTLAPGRYRLRARLGSASRSGLREAEQWLVVAPDGCLPVEEKLGRRRAFGIWANLYSLRSARNQGVGDFSDLRRLARFAGRAGAAFVGVNPLHALRNRDGDVSPYSPTSRLFRNPLYLDVEAVPELATCRAARRRLAGGACRRALEELRAGDRVRYAESAAWKTAVLRDLHRDFSALPDSAPRRRAYAVFRRRAGRRLEEFATFCALEEVQAERGLPRDWRRWPEELRHPGSPAVARFCAERARDVDFHAFLQFELDRQLASAARASRRAGCAVGLYQDLALGSAPSGFDTWAAPELFAPGVSLGAPPDAYAPSGQDWGIPPFHPRRLAEGSYAFFGELLRAAFCHAGALRIDHILGFVRQWWVPQGVPASEGAYVRVPHDDLFGVLALESRRAGALVIGEDLGTVPRQVPSLLARWGILSSRVLLFERDRRGRFRSAARYSPRALVSANTHDLPTLRAFLEGRDLALRRELGLLPDDDALALALEERERELAALFARLRAGGHLGAGRPDPPELARAVHAFLASTRAPLLGLSLDDLAGESEPVNVPGVSHERFPSWTRRMRLSLEALPRDPGAGRAPARAAERHAPPK
jgi:4-alpha-glucanotransferase